MGMVLDDFEELTKVPDHPLSTDEKWAEAVRVFRRIAFSGPEFNNRAGNRPLAGGIEVFARLFLARHGIGPNGDLTDHTCPTCGHSLEGDHPCNGSTNGEPHTE